MASSQRTTGFSCLVPELPESRFHDEVAKGAVVSLIGALGASWLLFLVETLTRAPTRASVWVRAHYVAAEHAHGRQSARSHPELHQQGSIFTTNHSGLMERPRFTMRHFLLLYGSPCTRYFKTVWLLLVSETPSKVTSHVTQTYCQWRSLTELLASHPGECWVSHRIHRRGTPCGFYRSVASTLETCELARFGVAALGPAGRWHELRCLQMLAEAEGLQDANVMSGSGARP